MNKNGTLFFILSILLAMDCAASDSRAIKLV